MHEVRFHGRAGQGILTASRLFAQAAILDGKYAQAFPDFGPERLGSPVAHLPASMTNQSKSGAKYTPRQPSQSSKKAYWRQCL